MEDLSCVTFVFVLTTGWTTLTLIYSIDRLSANGWEGQSIVITLSRTCAPTRPIAGPTRGPACVFPSGYMSDYSTPPRVTQNLAAPGSPE